MIALVDSDIVAFRCAAASENDPLEIAIVRTDELMQRILYETNATEYKAFLTGSNNFRYSIYPEYKANRKDTPKPRHLQHIREHLVTVWNASVTDGIEADDALGIEQCSYPLEDESTVICSIDKDLLMIPGHHYNFVKQELRYISPLEGLKNFYIQLIMGDRSDNIPGYDGKMRQTVPKFLESRIEDINWCQEERDMFNIVSQMYAEQAIWTDEWASILDRNAQCLWIQRKDNDKWRSPYNRENTEQ